MQSNEIFNNVINFIKNLMKKFRFNSNFDWIYVCVMFFKYKLPWKLATRHVINRWLIRWIVGDCVNTKFFSLSLYVCTINFDFSKIFFVFEFLISSTNRKLKIFASSKISLRLMIWKTSFFKKSKISYCRKTMYDDYVFWDMLKLFITKQTSKKIKLICTKCFLNHSQFRLIDCENDIKLNVIETWLSNNY